MRPKLCLSCSLAGSCFASFSLLKFRRSSLQLRLLPGDLLELASCLRHHASLLSFLLHADAYPWQS